MTASNLRLPTRRGLFAQEFENDEPSSGSSVVLGLRFREDDGCHCSKRPNEGSLRSARAQHGARIVAEKWR